MKACRSLLPLILFGLLALPPLAAADEQEVPTAEEVKLSTGEPPVIPHKVSDREEGEACLKCHRKGTKKAPATSHPERLGCTQCHVRGVTGSGKGR